MSTIKSSRTEADYHQALAWIVAIFEASPGSSEFDKLDILGTLACAYKDPHYTLLLSMTPMQYIKYKMAERDLTAWLGGENWVSKILNCKLKLTAKMMKALHENPVLSTEMLLTAA